MILRELLLFPLVLVASGALVAAYLWLFHGVLDRKEIVSAASAMTIGVFAGRAWQRRAVR